MGEIQNLQLQSSICEVKDYYSSNSSLPSPKGTRLSETKAESFKTIVMPAMMTGSITLEDEMTNMKAILEKLTRESEEKGERTKLQDENIGKMTKKLEK